MYKDLKVDSPYNTYKHKGLPVGPICSPSLEAIDGVLNPQKNDYLYFQMDTVKNDGSNIFSKTYEELRRLLRLQKRQQKPQQRLQNKKQRRNKALIC